MLFVVVTISVILLLYALLITSYTFGWNKIKKISQEGFFPKVSIVIAIRNEENQIAPLLKSLQSQIYHSDKLEFILVNDHSVHPPLPQL